MSGSIRVVIAPDPQHLPSSEIHDQGIMTDFLAARLYEPGKAAKASLQSGAIILRLSPSCQSAIHLSLGIDKPRGMIHLTRGLYRQDKRSGVCFAQLPGQPAAGQNRNQAGISLVQEMGPQARQSGLFCSKGWCPGSKSTSATADSRTDVIFGQHRTREHVPNSGGTCPRCH